MCVNSDDDFLKWANKQTNQKFDDHFFFEKNKNFFWISSFIEKQFRKRKRGKKFPTILVWFWHSIMESKNFIRIYFNWNDSVNQQQFLGILVDSCCCSHYQFGLWMMPEITSFKQQQQTRKPKNKDFINRLTIDYW